MDAARMWSSIAPALQPPPWMYMKTGNGPLRPFGRKRSTFCFGCGPYATLALSGAGIVQRAFVDGLT